MTTTMPMERIIEARYPGTCRDCGQGIMAGTRIRWSREGGSSHERCPERIPEHIRSMRWHGEPERGVRTLSTERTCDRRSCGQPIRPGDREVSIDVRRKGRSSDDYLTYHEACWDEMCQPRDVETPRPAPVMGGHSEVRQPMRRRGPGGSWCVRCGGPACDGSGICEMCE